MEICEKNKRNKWESTLTKPKKTTELSFQEKE